MDVESIRLLDEVNDLDVLEVHYLTELGEERTVVDCGRRRWVGYCGW